MKFNYGMMHKHGNPGYKARPGAMVDMDGAKAPKAVPDKNMARDSQVKGKPGVRNPRKGKEAIPDSFNGKTYGGGSNRGDKAVHDKVMMGNPGMKNARGGRVQKHAMFLG